ncbi:MAG: single-stranded-DNA-specific exonuclease RecJ [Pseudomonadota bacterium]|jgi:single-stranded-DNA-specific exonuclease|nr:single-stranded-DNA-specific exonuclease RecJ [Alphaproteobacteria bacterium]
MMRSLKGFDWVLAAAEDRLVMQYMQSFELPELLSRILVSRNIQHDKVEEFLLPSLKKYLPDPSILKDMDQAVEKVITAIQEQKKIVIYGDYDVDGATSSALLRRYFRDIGISTGLYIPDRLDEGYGANAQALKKLSQDGYSVCLMVDCGTTAFEALDEAKKCGLDVLVFDHHTAETRLPNAIIVNPNRLDQDLGERTDLKLLCAAGVVFLFLVALNRSLRHLDYFKTIQEPDLLSYLDIVALGTVCDVMPLKGLNRALVTQGLKVARSRKNLGLATLADIAGLKTGITSAYAFGFVIGPRVNAGGRVGKTDLGSKLLFTQDLLEAQEIATQLNTLNLQRQEIEQQVLAEAIIQVDQNSLDTRSIIMVKGDNWHPGVIGIVSSRLKEKYHKPALVVTDWEGEQKGSGRSVTGLDMGVLMHQAVHKGLLSKGGGHAMAAGFTITNGCYDEFYDFIDQAAFPHMQNRELKLSIDGYLTVDGLNQQFMQHVQQLEPYGNGHPTPTFAFKHMVCVFADVVGEYHIRLQLQDETGKRLKAMAFRAMQTPLQKILEHRGPVEVAGNIKVDEWQGRQQLTLIVDDIRI